MPSDGYHTPICIQIIRPKLNETLLVWHPPVSVYLSSNALIPQNAALAKAEQERAASEEEEKLLKAKLTAK